MNRRWLAGLLSTVFIVGTAAFAKPMNAPTPEEAVSTSPLITTAKFVGYELPKKDSEEALYMGGLLATYDIGKVLKNKATPPGLPLTIQVNYAFQDGSACLMDQSWHFDPKKMPKKGSTWILFLNWPERNQPFRTYRGDYGRWPATGEQLKRVEALLQKTAQP